MCILKLTDRILIDTLLLRLLSDAYRLRTAADPLRKDPGWLSSSQTEHAGKITMPTQVPNVEAQNS